MVYLLASMAIMAGLGTTHNIGEASPSAMVYTEAGWQRLVAEASFDTADKVETGNGWVSRLGADAWAGPVSLGASWAHRQTNVWTKDVFFLRASAKRGPVRILAEVAPSSPNAEAKLEMRLRSRGHVAVEPSWFVEWYRDGRGQRRMGYGAGLRVGWATDGGGRR